MSLLLHGKLPFAQNETSLFGRVGACYHLETTLAHTLHPVAEWNKTAHRCRANVAQRFHHFFQHRTDVKIIVYAWVNDQDSLRAYNSKTDAYHGFAGMLNKGNPPNTLSCP